MICFHGCYSIGDDTLRGVNHRKKGTGNTLTALKSIRVDRLPDGQPIYIVLDDLSARTGAKIRRRAERSATASIHASSKPFPGTDLAQRLSATA